METFLTGILYILLLGGLWTSFVTCGSGLEIMAGSGSDQSDKIPLILSTYEALYPCIVFTLLVHHQDQDHRNHDYISYISQQALQLGAIRNPNLVYKLFTPLQNSTIAHLKFPGRETQKNTPTCILTTLEFSNFPHSLNPEGAAGGNGNSNILNLPLILLPLGKLLMPRLTPILLADADKLLIITETLDELKTSLKQPEFGARIKFKAGFPRRDSGNSPKTNVQDVQVYSACEFCANRDGIFPISSLNLWADYEDNFEGAPLRVSGPIATQTRFNWTTVGGPGGKKVVSNGVLVPVLLFVQNAFNFSIVIIPAGRGGGTGIKLPNGTWTGAMGDIKEGIADMGMCTAETYARTQIVDFTPVVNWEPITFISGPPKKIYAIFAVFWPLSNQVWVGLSILTTAAILLIRLSFHARRGHPAKHWPISNITEYIIGSFLEEGPALPRDIPVTAKLFLVIWLFCSMIVTTAYLSKLVGFLTFPLVDQVPQTADELVVSRFQWGLTYMGGAAYYLIKASKTKTFQGIFSKMELISNHFSCLERTLTSRFICIGYKIIPDFYLNNDLKIKPGQSPIIVSENYFISVPVGISMQQRSPFGPKLIQVVYKFTAAGLVPEWERQDFRAIRQRNREKQIGTTGKGPRGLSDVSQGGGAKEDGLLTLKHLKGAFIILFFGVTVSTLGFLFERGRSYCANRSRRKMQKQAW